MFCSVATNAEFWHVSSGWQYCQHGHQLVQLHLPVLLNQQTLTATSRFNQLINGYGA
jgi:hypothetical protein